ncbi:TrbI/VirB10 family protein [Dankookia rubra]|uniref:TrbI/VirB10 family protein n=1 Tax=Dankookia rubra TaxID=1442381 RepID=UPI0014092952|nr:TrbI/VirB10 family protein [Dankookia rubra]
MTPTREATAAPATTLAPAPAAVEDDIRAQALRQQWQQYYQQISQVREQRRQAAVDALRGDTSIVMAEGNTRQSGGNADIAAARAELQQAQAAAAAGVGGGGGQQVSRTPRPGSLYEGPSDPSRDYLNAGVTPPISRYEVKAGDPILIRFTSGVSNEAPGQWTAMVAKPVFDHATGLHTLIPAGTRVVGTYDQMMTVGSERLPGGATRLIFPGEGGGSLDLGSMPVGDQAGYSGMRDEVNHHYGRLILNTVLIGLAGAGAQLTQPHGSSSYGHGIDASQILAAQLGLQFGQVGAEYARRQLQNKPTHTIRPGWTGTIQVTQDVAFAGEWVEGVGFVP